jgi:hypothetical protein
MRKSEWLLASSILLVGFGFGHAGCYTSGLPGGNGAAGASNASGGGGGLAARTDAGADASAKCGSNADCVSHGANHVCDTNSGECVACTIDQDCPADAGVDPYCHLNTCKAYVACQYPGKCPGSSDLCDIPSKHCVECISNVDCPTVGTACFANLCRTTCATSKSCTAPTTYCAIADGGTGFCTETCTINSDCSPGYKCSAMACVLAN